MTKRCTEEGCQALAVTGTSLCDDHTWEEKKRKAEARMRLARDGGNSHEATNAAVAACAMMKGLEFYPNTPMIARARGIYDAATGDARRPAALGLARASKGSRILRKQEIEQIQKAEVEAAKKRERASRPSTPTEIVEGAMSWLFTGISVAMSALETSDGRPISEKADKIRQELSGIDAGIKRVRDTLDGTSRATRKTKSKQTKATKPSKARKTKKRARQTTRGSAR